MNIKLSVIVLCALFSVNNAVPTEQEIETRISGMNLTNTDELSSYIVEIFSPYRDHIRMLIKESMSFTTRPRPRADFITCDVCKPAVPLIRLFLGKVPDALIINVVIQACLVLDLAPAPDLCKPTIESYAIPTLYILKNRPDLKMEDFCGILNPGCTEVNTDLTNWEVIIDDNKPPTQNLPLPDVEKTKIIQITDVHLDLDYLEGANADCPHPICCRNETGEGENKAGRFGHFNCALPKPGLDAIYDHAKETHSDAKYIFLTGDYIHSGVWLYNEVENSRHISSVTTALRAAFPNTPIFPVTGNHEPDVVNMYPPSTIRPDFDLTWMYTSASAQFTDYIPADQLLLFKKGGYYTVKPNASENLRLIVVNTNLCYVNNFWLAYDSIDPEGQLQWFSDELLMAEQAGDVVYVVGHILPGSGSCWPIWSAQFDAIINRFEGIIKAQFYGHSHSEYFTLAFEKGTDRPISTSYVAPSSVTDGMHAGYKVYFADGERGMDSTWEIVDHESWILNITESNIADSPNLSKVFNAREDYGLTSFRPEALKEFVYKMAVDDTLFSSFVWNRHKGDGPRYRRSSCKVGDKECKIGYLCDLVESNSADRSQCDKIRAFVENPDSTTTIDPIDSTTTIDPIDSTTTTDPIDSTTTIKPIDSSTTIDPVDSTTTTNPIDSTTTTNPIDSTTTTNPIDSTTTTNPIDSTTTTNPSSTTIKSAGTKPFGYSGLWSASIIVTVYIFNEVMILQS